MRPSPRMLCVPVLALLMGSLEVCAGQLRYPSQGRPKDWPGTVQWDDTRPTGWAGRMSADDVPIMAPDTRDSVSPLCGPVAPDDTMQRSTSSFLAPLPAALELRPVPHVDIVSAPEGSAGIFVRAAPNPGILYMLETGASTVGGIPFPRVTNGNGYAPFSFAWSVPKAARRGLLLAGCLLGALGIVEARRLTRGADAVGA